MSIYASEHIRSHMAGFFGESSTQYDRDILQVVPVYEQMFAELLDHVWLPLDAPLHIVEMGCGTGNLTRLLLHTYAKATLTVVDASDEMLARAREKMSSADLARTEFKTALFNEVELPDNSVDLVISSLALHHVPDEHKLALYQRIYGWLRPGGKFRCADQCLTLPLPQGPDYDWARWQAWVKANGMDDATMAHWMSHFNTADHYASLAEHFRWLEQAGFAAVDSYWRIMFWTIFGAEKPLTP